MGAHRKAHRPVPGWVLRLPLALAAGCRTGITEERFDAWEAHLEEVIAFASRSNESCAGLEGAVRREDCYLAWDAMLRALFASRIAGATAYLAQDREGVERVVRELVSRVRALARTSDDPDGDGVVTR